MKATKDFMDKLWKSKFGSEKSEDASKHEEKEEKVEKEEPKSSDDTEDEVEGEENLATSTSSSTIHHSRFAALEMLKKMLGLSLADKSEPETCCVKDLTIKGIANAIVEGQCKLSSSLITVLF
jgi:hypothetical protein